MRFASEFTVRFGEIDQANVVYYPRFFHYFHQAFEEWFGECLGVSYADLVKKRNIGFPSVKVETEFLRPLNYGDRVRIELELAEIGNKSITVRYTGYRLPDEKLVAKALIKTVAIHNDTFESIPIDDDLRERFRRFQES